MSLKKSLRTPLACVVLEIGLLAGVPMRPEQIKDLMQMMIQPNVSHTVPADQGTDDDPPEERHNVR